MQVPTHPHSRMVDQDIGLGLGASLNSGLGKLCWAGLGWAGLGFAGQVSQCGRMF